MNLSADIFECPKRRMDGAKGRLPTKFPKKHPNKPTRLPSRCVRLHLPVRARGCHEERPGALGRVSIPLYTPLKTGESCDLSSGYQRLIPKEGQIM